MVHNCSLLTSVDVWHWVCHKNYLEIIAMVWEIFYFQNFIQVICFLFKDIYKKWGGGGPPWIIFVHYLDHWTYDVGIAIKLFGKYFKCMGNFYFLNIIQVNCYLYGAIKVRGGTSLYHICPLSGSLDVWCWDCYKNIWKIFQMYG